MKNFKSITLLSCFLSLIAFTVFFSSCKQNEDFAAVEKEEAAELEVPVGENAIIYQLPDEYNNMPEEELRKFIENLSEEDFLKIAVVVPDGQVEDRWCTSWKYQGTRCRPDVRCSVEGEFNAEDILSCWYYRVGGSREACKATKFL